jgi:L-alanine-DL-glutamate epimerase-like enolase superfamily enzyme
MQLKVIVITIRKVDVHLVRLRFEEPFAITYGSCYESHTVIVKVFSDDNFVGVGEAAPSVATAETSETILQALDRIIRHLKGADTEEIGDLIEKMDKATSQNPSAKAAIEIALHDIIGQRAKKPVFNLLGGFREVQTDLSISLKKPKEMAQDAVKAVREGFTILKIKVGSSPVEDFERVNSVRNAVGPDIALGIVVNQGWTVSQAIEMLKKLETIGIEYVEQPVKANDVKGLLQVRRNSSIPVMADESVCSVNDARRIINNEAADLINIKLMKCGGIQKAKKIASMAEAANISCIVGCMYESAIGVTAGTHMASSLRNLKFADLDSDILLKDKLVLEGGATLKSSKRILPSSPGLGIAKLNEKLLGKPIRRYILS